MRHLMNLEQGPFNQIKNGIKTIESRLYDDKRKAIALGDEIEFTSRETKECVTVRVTGFTVKENFRALTDAFPPESFGERSREEALVHLAKYYTKADEERYGVIGIHIATR